MLAERDPNLPRRRRSYGIYAYTGREWDPEISLYYYRARYYDPKIGRFLSEDPIGLKGGINLYAYVSSNPLRWTDPYGLVGVGFWGAGVSVAWGGPELALLFDGFCSIVQDLKGNTGILCCTGAGFGITSPFGKNVGIHGMGALCPTCETICDMAGEYAGGQAGAAAGAGWEATAGASWTEDHFTITAGAGPAMGGGGSGGAVYGSCKIVFSSPIECCQGEESP